MGQSLLGAGLLLLVAVVVGFFALARSERTNCFVHFDSAAAADAAAAEGRSLGFDVVVDRWRENYYSLIFETGETGEDASELTKAFSGIVKEYEGGLGHPGNGCLEKPYLD